MPPLPSQRVPDGRTTDEHIFHAIYATMVFVVAYALITIERFNKTMVALAGAVAVFFLPVINSDEVFYSRDTGIDWDVIFLLLGMMIIISVVRQTGCSNTWRSGRPSAPRARRCGS